MFIYSTSPKIPLVCADTVVHISAREDYGTAAVDCLWTMAKGLTNLIIFGRVPLDCFECPTKYNSTELTCPVLHELDNKITQNNTKSIKVITRQSFSSCFPKTEKLLKCVGACVSHFVSPLLVNFIVKLRYPYFFTGCSTGCFDCCFKSGKLCIPHAKQLERKRVEDALLAGGPSQSQRDEEARRLAKGVFKEDAIHGGWMCVVYLFSLCVTLQHRISMFCCFSNCCRSTCYSR